MYRTAVIVTVLAAASLIMGGEVASHPPANPSHNPWFDLPSPTVPATQLGEQAASVEYTTDETDWLKVSGRPGTGGDQDDYSQALEPFLDWGTDTLIGSTGMMPSFGRLSTDAAPNGDLYVGVLAPVSGVADTVWVWRSTNNGGSWQVVRNFTGNASTGGISDYVIRIGSDAGGTWVYHFLLYDGNTTDGGLWVQRHRPAGTPFAWRQIIVRGDTLTSIAADRNMESPQHLFVGYTTSSARFYMWSSKDSAQTWGNQTYVHNLTHPRIGIAAGGDKYVYCAFLHSTDSTFYWVGRHTNNLEPGGSWGFARPDSNTNNRFRHVSVAAARSAPGGSQTAIVFNTHRYVPNSNIGPRYAWTTNGGTSWTASFWPPTNQSRSTWDFRHPYIRCSYGADALRAVISGPEPTVNWDTLFYAWVASATPTNWQGRATPNDRRHTGEYAAGVDFSSGLSGGYIAYREYAQRRVWFDGWNYTGLEEGSAPVRIPEAKLPTFFGRDGALNLSLSASAEVRAVLYDRTGRNAGTVYHGRLNAGEHRLPVQTGSLAEGVYFLHLNLDGKAQTAKLVHVR